MSGEGNEALVCRYFEEASGRRPLAAVNEFSPFVTCFYRVLDLFSGRFRYDNAGHKLLCRQHYGRSEELRATGMLLGLGPRRGYKEIEAILEVGKSALLYSDGFVEAHGLEGEIFGHSRLRALMAEYGDDGSLVDYLLEKIYSCSYEDWEQEDYFTLVALTGERAR
jgi:serine phosphatase RsbU (regulator of sigma subunit)